MPLEYVDSDGRVPRGMTEISNAGLMRQMLLLVLTLDAGGVLEVGGLGDPERVDQLMHDYELKISGLGHGTIRLEAKKK